MLIRIGMALIAALVLAPAAGALAQDAAATEPAAATRTPWPAPVGYRQPRVQDIPAVKAAKDGHDIALERLQRALDDRLRICSGC
jgi:uncharacterized protein YdeI (BOF family)